VYSHSFAVFVQLRRYINVHASSSFNPASYTPDDGQLGVTQSEEKKTYEHSLGDLLSWGTPYETEYRSTFIFSVLEQHAELVEPFLA
jgi:hypothetical protein